MAKIAHRKGEAAVKEDDAVIASLSRAGEAAVSHILDGICDILRRNSQWMYQINALLNKCHKEWTAVLMSSIENHGSEASPSCGEKPGTVWRLRQAINNFGHIGRHTMQWLSCSKHI